MIPHKIIQIENQVKNNLGGKKTYLNHVFNAISGLGITATMSKRQYFIKSTLI